jgi:hypothetical protein
MSLEDRLFPKDEGLLTKFDNWMIRQTKQLGEAYQSETGNSYTALVESIHHASSKLSYCLTGQKCFKREIVYESPLEEELRLEVVGFTKTKEKKHRLTHFGGGVGMVLHGIATASAGLAFGTLSGEGSGYAALLTGAGAYFLAFGTGLVGDSVSHYLSKVTLPPPQKKYKGEPAYPSILLGPIGNKQ